MSVYGICMVKDEIDILPATLAHMAGQVDAIVVADNGSTDGTFEWLVEEWARKADHSFRPGPGFFQSIPAHCAYTGTEPPRTVLRDSEVGYYQSRKMSALAAFAAAAGSSWVVPFDADEAWLPLNPEWGTVAQVLEGLPPDEAIAPALLYDHVPSALDVAHGTPLQTIVWRRLEPAPLPKVAVRPRGAVTIEQGNHDAHYPGRSPGPVLQVRHFPYRSVEQMISKARNGGAAYEATDLPETFGQHWRDYNRLSDEQIGDAFRTWFWSANPPGEGLVHDPLGPLAERSRRRAQVPPPRVL